VITGVDGSWADVLYRQSSGSESYGYLNHIGERQSIDLSRSFGSCSSAPVVAGGDLDGDGDEDLIFCGQVSCASSALVCFADGFDEEAANPLHPDRHTKPWLYAALFTDWPASEDSDAQLTIYPWEMPSAGPASTATDLRVTVWARPDDPGPIVAQCLVDAFFSPSSTICTVDIPTPRMDPLPRYLVLDFSYVRRNSSGEITRDLPAWIGEIDRENPPGSGAGGEITGGIHRPPPPPSPVPPDPP